MREYFSLQDCLSFVANRQWKYYICLKKLKIPFPTKSCRNTGRFEYTCICVYRLFSLLYKLCSQSLQGSFCDYKVTLLENATWATIFQFYSLRLCWVNDKTRNRIICWTARNSFPMKPRRLVHVFLFTTSCFMVVINIFHTYTRCGWRKGSNKNLIWFFFLNKFPVRNLIRCCYANLFILNATV